MIKFFRKIRQKLLTENNTSRYFKYAFGEIILVVIGILIALQINNWNNDLQIKKNNKSYLNKMLKDLQNINKRLNSIVYSYADDNNFGYPSLQEAQKDADSILNLTYLGLKKKDLHFIANAKYFQGNTRLNIYDNTYQELINTGKLYSVGSENLIKSIQNYYKMCERETIYQEGNIDEIDYGMNLFNSGFSNLLMDYNRNRNFFDIKNYPFYFDVNTPEYKSFQLGIYKIYGGQEANMNKMLQIIKDTDILENVIKEELKTYD